MATLALSIAVLALLVAVVTLFGYSSLLAEIRRLQDFARMARLDHRSVEEFAGEGLALVLVTEDGCFACAERLDDYRELANDRSTSLRLIVAHSGEPERLPPLPDTVAVQADPRLIGRLGIGILPSAIVVDGEGQELARTVVGSEQALEDIHRWATERVTRDTTATDLGATP